jgi:hypothetical protein
LIFTTNYAVNNLMLYKILEAAELSAASD